MLAITEMFNRDKARGHVNKVGKASFFNCKRHMTRTLWYDGCINKCFVVLDGEAYEFKRHTNQSEPGLIIGRI